MATVNVCLAKSQTRSGYNGAIPITLSVPYGKADQTPSSTAAQSSLSVPSDADPFEYVWLITTSGANIRVRFGTNPTATATGDILILDGQTRMFGASIASEKVSVVTATV